MGVATKHKIVTTNCCLVAENVNFVSGMIHAV